jgi:cell wall-associated NlpC family hydrolase
MRPRKNLRAAAVAVVATTTVLLGVAGPAPSPAAGLAPDRLVVLAGSAHHLVYADYPIRANGRVNYSQGELHARSANGSDRDLGAGFGDTDPHSAAPYSFSLVGSTLTASSSADPTHVEWWDLAAHTHGVGTVPAGARWQGSAPGGWLLVAADNETVEVQSTAGAVTSYGEPLPAEAAAGGTLEAVSGPQGIVTVGQRSGELTYQRWQFPLPVTSLDLGADAGSTGMSCDDASGAIVGCVDRGPDGDGTTELAVPLDGSPARAYAGCGGDPVAFATKLVWVCGTRHAHPYFGSLSSTAKRSTVSVAALEGVSALGRFVIAGPKQQEILGVSSARGRRQVLVAIPSPIARLDATNLRAAAKAVQAAAVARGALHALPPQQFPAQVVLASADALIAAARAKDPTLVPKDTRSVMGPLPKALRHRPHRRPHHHRVTGTRSLQRFSHSVPDRGSPGIGVHARHGGSVAAPFQRADGVYVNPRLPAPANPTVGMVALRAALQKLGQPYVWAGGGPGTFDCSGLVQWAYARAGRRFTHFTGAQWNEARLIKPRQILPGDLILFEHRIGRHEVIHHVGLYLGAGWMVNAPFTGQYVDVVPVSSGVAGVVRP